MKRCISTVNWLSSNLFLCLFKKLNFPNEVLCRKQQMILLSSLRLFIICKSRRSLPSSIVRTPKNMARLVSTHRRWTWRPISISPKRKESFSGSIFSPYSPFPSLSLSSPRNLGTPPKGSSPLITTTMPTKLQRIGRKVRHLIPRLRYWCADSKRKCRQLLCRLWASVQLHLAWQQLRLLLPAQCEFEFFAWRVLLSWPHSVRLPESKEPGFVRSQQLGKLWAYMLEKVDCFVLYLTEIWRDE